MATLPSIQTYIPSGYLLHSPSYLSPTTPLPPSSGADRGAREKRKEKPYQNFVTVYVGDLSDLVKDENLFEFFQKAGMNIVKVKVCYDFSTGNSLGYGYANFLNHQDAALAIEKLNNTILFGRQIRLMWRARNSRALKNGIANIHVKNLPLSVDNAGLYEIFAKIGSVLSVKVMRNDDGSSRGYGFVQFATKELADAAIKAIDGTSIDGKKLMVARYVKKSERKGNDLESFNNVYVKNIDKEIDETLIRLKFSQFGRVTSIEIVKDENGNPKGFCFVCFKNHDSAKAAVQEMNGIDLGNKILYVGRAMKKAERAQFLQSQKEKRMKERQMKTQGSNLFVKNLCEKVDDKILHKYFSQCGLIISAKVMRNDRGISKGFGFVCYSKPQEAQKAIATINRQFFYGMPLYVALHEKKEDRKVKMEKRFKTVPALNGSSTTNSSALIPVMYPSMYYNPSPMNVVPQVQYNQSFMNQSYNNVGGVGSTWKQPSGFSFPASTSPPVSQQAPNNRSKKFYSRGRNNNMSPRKNTYRPKLKNFVMKYVPVRRFDTDNNNPSTSGSKESEILVVQKTTENLQAEMEKLVHTVAIAGLPESESEPEPSLKSQETASPNCVSTEN